MKQSAVITYEPGIYELPQELPNNLKSDFHLPQKIFLFASIKPFKNDKKMLFISS